ncbi:MAG TPA: PAS domain-containing protein, partial [Alphaproteobacteria bacterium]|nr:PAS domain-containing protein [Alphaproteobacteria bacterium]
MSTLDANGFRALFEAAPGNFLVLDPGFRIVAASDGYVRAVLGSRSEMIGRSVFDGYRDSPGVSAA